MLHDRKVLLEHELQKAKTQAAEMYLQLAVQNDSVHNTEYQDLKDKISNLSFDLNLVDTLIDQGHK